MGCNTSTTKSHDGGWAVGVCCRRSGAHKGVRRLEEEEDDSVVLPYSPSSSLCEWYNKQLEEGCRRYSAPIDEPARIEKHRSSIHPRAGDEKGIQNGNGLMRKTSELTVAVVREPNRLTMYHMRALERRVGRGMFSDVTLADMTVCTVPRSLWKGAGEKGDRTDEGSDHHMKYLIACKEYSMKNLSWATSEQLVKEAEHLCHLKSNNRLLKVFLVERVPDNSDNGSGGVSTSCAEAASRTLPFCADPLVLLKNPALSVDLPQKNAKLRVYMEYAKYGTLRDVLLKEVPDKFGKAYMHELTVRAYMREVLLALAVLHEADIPHGDLCAKNIFISNPISRVYGTAYPAYISDIPAGRLDKASSRAVSRALISTTTDATHFLTGTEPSASRAEGSAGHCEGRNAAERATGRSFRQRTPTVHHRSVGGAKNEPYGSQRTDPILRRGERAVSIVANRARTECDDCDSGCSHWVDDEVKHLIQDCSYIDGEVVSIPSSNSSVEGTNFGTNGLFKGGKVAKDGSVSSTHAFPHALSFAECGSIAENSTTAYIRSGGEVEARGLLSSRGHPTPVLVCGQQRTGDGSIHSSADVYHRKSKILVKLGHYGRIRSVLLSEKEDVSHLLGSVPHLAPESMGSGVLTPASDVYAFAMTFIELATPRGALYEDLYPGNTGQSRKRLAGAELSRMWMNNIKNYVEDNFHDVPLPQQLSEECRGMLRRCLSRVPAKRPTVVELLQHRYFLLGHWAAEAVRSGQIESPWRETDFEAAALACGLPLLPSVEECTGVVN
ncbi:protein kinase, putative [Trypanosoma brucei brucei TREU927]|uniref:Protein kinase, putative n=1 Tax=Trypanosoma brucei brucei (strain 927/4 GUTat10.1) TaxID=185431 RepID=Q38FT8_TRYB2|nr:protein kinase, putative [Trypanosoma brucei brucei TREU927]EAN76332.1 protein kinase, putative [Trypanosoma brucei brucei TREU927]